MASELLEYEDDDEVNETSGVGSKRGPTVPTAVLEKKDSSFKRETLTKQPQI